MQVASKFALTCEHVIPIRAPHIATARRQMEGADGCDAPSKLAGKQFTLIISDVNMPNMGGLEFLRQLKCSPEHKFTPVVMLTTESPQSCMAEGRAAGARA